MEIERDLVAYNRSATPSPSPSPQPPVDYEVEEDPDNMVIRGGGDAFDPDVDPDNMVVPGSRSVTPNYDDEGVYQAHTYHKFEPMYRQSFDPLAPFPFLTHWLCNPRCCRCRCPKSTLKHLDSGCSPSILLTKNLYIPQNENRALKSPAE
uniref:HDC16429 n=1 Tax=Drosophila melanogaster TaxID=7227 RepID=Q6IIZ8_DROME|nr:TPA_inf: HDC16429 [Drosophila melanogaster]